MKKFIKIVIFLLTGSTSMFGQKVSTTDSLKIVETAKILFSAIEANDMETIIGMTTDNVYCMICSDSIDFSDSPFIFEKNDFLENYLRNIKASKSYQRATKSNVSILINENNHRNGVLALWTIYKKDELAPGHEGGQFGIYFQKLNGQFKFGGMETIP